MIKFWKKTDSTIQINISRWCEFLESLPVYYDYKSKKHFEKNNNVLVPINIPIIKVIKNQMKWCGVPNNVIDFLDNNHKHYFSKHFLLNMKNISEETFRKKDVYAFKNVCLNLRNEKPEIVRDEVFREDQIVDFDFELDKDMTPGKIKNKDLKNYLQGICKHQFENEWVLDDSKFKYIKFMLGKYLLINRDVNDDKKLLWITDCNTGNNGGTGKSIFGKILLSLTPNYKTLDGRKINNLSDQQFILDGYNIHQPTIYVDDMTSFIEPLYCSITGQSIEIKKKFKTQFDIKFEFIPNMIVTSNCIPHNYMSEFSTRRRVDLIMLSSYFRQEEEKYNLNNSNLLRWNKDKDWNDFYNDLIRLVLYFKKFKNKKVTYNHLENKDMLLKLNNIDFSISDFIDENKVILEKGILCRELMDRYIIFKNDNNLNRRKILKDMENFFHINNILYEYYMHKTKIRIFNQ